MLTYLIRSGWFSAIIMMLLESDREYYLSRRTFLSLTKNISFSHEGHFFLSLRIFLSLTELTDLTELFCALFRTHRRPPAYRIHRTLLPKMGVRFCEIGWLNVSVECCVFCSSVFFCERKNNCETRWGVFSLTELTDLTEPFAHSFEPTEGLRHTEFTEPFSYYHY